jgi:formate dehydrogenase subunit delta
MSPTSAGAEPQIHVTTTQKLVYMANQISQFFAAQGREEKAVAGTADHIKSFWDPSMRKGIFAHLDATGGEGLDPVALKAIQKLRSAAPSAIAAELAAAHLPSGSGPGDDAG